MSEHVSITSYQVGGDDLIAVDLFRYDPEEETFARDHLSEEFRVDIEEDEDVPDNFDLIGLAEDYMEPAEVWAVWADGHEWGTVLVTDEAEPSLLHQDFYEESEG